MPQDCMEHSGAQCDAKHTQSRGAPCPQYRGDWWTRYPRELGQKAKKSFGTFSVPFPVRSAGSDKELGLQPDGITGPGICMCKGRREAEIPRPEKVMTLVFSPPSMQQTESRWAITFIQTANTTSPFQHCDLERGGQHTNTPTHTLEPSGFRLQPPQNQLKLPLAAWGFSRQELHPVLHLSQPDPGFWLPLVWTQMENRKEQGREAKSYGCREAMVLMCGS